jgi:hypothetical protein
LIEYWLIDLLLGRGLAFVDDRLHQTHLKAFSFIVAAKKNIATGIVTHGNVLVFIFLLN